MEQISENNVKELVKFDTTKKVFYKIIKREILVKYMYNDTYHPIYQILLSGPKTISEIKIEYNSYVRNEKKKNSKSKLKEKEENTIYKNIVKELIPSGLVSEYGRLVDLSANSRASKIVYHTSALFFIPNNYKSDILDNEFGEIFSEILGILLSRHFDNKFSSNKNLIIYFKKVYDRIYNELISFFDKLEGIFGEELENGTFDDHPALAPFRKLSYSSYTKLLDFFVKLMFVDMVDKDQSIISSFKPYFTKLKNDKLVETKDTLNFPSPKDKKERIIVKKGINQPIIMPVPASDWERYFNDINYNFIFKLLKYDMLTVKEIHEKHYDAILDIIKFYEKQLELYGNDKGFHSNYTSEQPPNKKTENTIYRYIRELVKAGYIIEAGRKIILGKTTTQILYTRSAKLYMYKVVPSVFWDTEQGFKVISCLCKYLALYLNKKECNEEKFKKFIINFSDKLYEGSENAIFSSKESAVIEPMRNLEKYIFQTLDDTLALFEFLLTQNTNNFKSSFNSTFIN